MKEKPIKKNKNSTLFVVNLIFTAITIVLFAVGIYMGNSMIELAHTDTPQATFDFFAILLPMLIYAFFFTFFAILGFFLTMKVKETGTPKQRKITLITRYTDITLLLGEVILVIVVYFLI